MSEPTATAPVTEANLVRQVEAMLRDGRELEALGVYYVVGACTCGKYAAGPWAIVTVRPGLQLHWCTSCGRPAVPNRERVLGATPWAKGDVAVYDGRLVQLEGAPGPTGAVRLTILEGNTDDEPDTRLQAHVALLNLED